MSKSIKDQIYDVVVAHFGPAITAIREGVAKIEGEFAAEDHKMVASLHDALAEMKEGLEKREELF